MAKKCFKCGKEIGFFDKKVGVKDGYICEDCAHKSSLTDYIGVSSPLTYDELLIASEQKKEAKARIQEENDFVRNFNVTYSPSSVALFDDEGRTALLAPSYSDSGVPSAAYSLISYDQIVDYELLENGKNIASGVGRAVAGKMLFGDVGAIVGAATRGEKQVCDSLKIKITLNIADSPTFYISLIKDAINKESPAYARRMKIAQDIMSKLQLIISENNNMFRDRAIEEKDPAGELRRYKELYDESIISLDEFNAKKKQILGL